MSELVTFLKKSNIEREINFHASHNSSVSIFVFNKPTSSYLQMNVVDANITVVSSEFVSGICEGELGFQ